jgi:hypothetical protein
MIAPATALLTYLWHYLVARTLYDQLLRPLIHGRVPAVLIVVCVAMAAFALGRLTRRRV